MQAGSLHHNAGCHCFLLWCGCLDCTQNGEIPHAEYRVRAMAFANSVASCTVSLIHSQL